MIKITKIKKFENDGSQGVEWEVCQYYENGRYRDHLYLSQSEFEELKEKLKDHDAQ